MEQADAENLTIPHIVLASKDEPADVVNHYTDILARNGIGGHVETYTTMWHGWMGARARLDEKESSAEYIRGYVDRMRRRDCADHIRYTQVADFFEKYLQ